MRQADNQLLGVDLRHTPPHLGAFAQALHGSALCLIVLVFHGGACVVVGVRSFSARLSTCFPWEDVTKKLWMYLEFEQLHILWKASL